MQLSHEQIKDAVIDLPISASIIGWVTFANVEQTLHLLGLGIGITLGLIRLYMMLKELKNGKGSSPK